MDTATQTAPAVAALAAHIAELCAAAQVTITWRTSGGRAWRRTRRIAIAPIRSVITYAVALHEIGHILGPHPPHRLPREVAAWQWAEAHARPWTPAMAAKRDASLASYRRWAERCQHRVHPPIIPPDFPSPRKSTAGPPS
jgi:hypothetical protein